MVIGKSYKSDIINFILPNQRYKIVGNYILDKFIFQTMFAIIFILCLFVAWQNNFKMNYFKCGDFTDYRFTDKEYLSTYRCDNPFYHETDWTNKKTLPPGEYGYKPGLLFNITINGAWILFIGAFILNHFIHNKNYNLIIEDENNDRDSDKKQN